MTFLDDIKGGWDDNLYQMKDEPVPEGHKGWRGQPGQASLFELQANLNFRGLEKQGPRINLDKISADAAESARGLIDEMVDQIEQEQAPRTYKPAQEHANDLDTAGAALEHFFLADRLPPIQHPARSHQVRGTIKAQARQEFSPDDDDPYESEYQPVEPEGQSEIEPEAEEVEADYDEQRDLWGTAGLFKPTAADVELRMQALNEEDDAA
jgi:hypothetical protein